MTRRTKVLLALAGAILGLVCLATVGVHQVRGAARGCFALGQLVGEVGPSVKLVGLASRVCAGDLGRLDQFFDGAGHTYPFDLSRPAAEMRRATETLAPAARLPFLRGMLIQFGRQHTHRPKTCLRFAQQLTALPRQDRAFGLANGMAWRLHGRLRSGVRLGRQLSGLTRSIFFEELGFQNARRHLRDRRPPRLERLRALSASDRCLGVHGFVRHQLIHDSDRVTAPELLAQVPARCWHHGLHGALRASQATSDKQLAAHLSRLITPTVERKLFALEYLP